MNASDIGEDGKIKNCGLEKIIVPANLVEQYQTHDVWSHYTVEAIPAA